MKVIFFLSLIAFSIHAHKKIFNINFTPDEMNAYLKSGGFKGYFTENEFWDFYDDLKLNAKFTNMISEKQLLGTTVKGNPIYGFFLSNDIRRLETFKQTKNILLFTSLHHSREPLTITMVILMMAEILKSFTSQKNGFAKKLLRDNIVFFVPALNTDSYKFIVNEFKKGKATEDILMIRKNRNIDLSCNKYTGGVDLNRNYNYKFAMDESGSSSDPCSEDYRGAYPFSEKETQAIKNFVDNNKNIVSCVNIHTYGNSWIYPFNYSHDPNDHFLQVKQPLFYQFYKDFENEMIRKGRKAHFGNAAFVLDYAANGEAGDWYTGAKKILNIDVELGNNNPLSERFYPPRKLLPKIVKYNWIVMRDFLSKHIINFEARKVKIHKSFPTKITFVLFNSSISNLINAIIELKPIFNKKKPQRYLINYSIKENANAKTIKKRLKSKGQMKATIKGRHILEVEILLDNKYDINNVSGLSMKIKRNEKNYLGFPDERYSFKINNNSNYYI